MQPCRGVQGSSWSGLGSTRHSTPSMLGWESSQLLLTKQSNESYQKTKQSHCHPCKANQPYGERQRLNLSWGCWAAIAGLGLGGVEGEEGSLKADERREGEGNQLAQTIMMPWRPSSWCRCETNLTQIREKWGEGRGWEVLRKIGEGGKWEKSRVLVAGLY